MKAYLQLTKRNCLLYIRDKGAVFFSLLSMLIVLLLMLVFLGHMNINTITGLLEQYGGSRDAAMDESNARHLIEYWTLAGILTINSITVTMAVMTQMVRDKDHNILSSFLASPVSEAVLALAYISAAIVIGTLMCIVPFGAALGYIVATGGVMLGAATIVKLMGCILLNVIIFSIITYFEACMVDSMSAWSGLNTVVGTLVGFFGAVYLPMGSLPEKVGTVLKCLPILHGTSLMRKLCCQGMLDKTFDGMPDQLITEYQNAMGITVEIGDKVVGAGFQVFFMIACGIAAFGGMMLIRFFNRKR